jgi:TPR repeat protein
MNRSLSVVLVTFLLCILGACGTPSDEAVNPSQVSVKNAQLRYALDRAAGRQDLETINKMASDGYQPARLVQAFVARKVEKDYPRAFALYSSILDSGSSEAKYWLGQMYASGLGVERDSQKAVALLREALHSGHKYSARPLGLLLLAGEGTDRDLVEAERMLKEFRKNVGLYDSVGEECESRVDCSKLLPYFRDWHKKASVDVESPTILCELGEVAGEDARSLFEAAMSKGSGLAAEKLSRWELEGTDRYIALRKLAVERGATEGMVQLAFEMKFKDKEYAKTLFLKLARSEHARREDRATGAYMAAEMSREDGFGSSAKTYYEMASELGETRADEALAKMYIAGDGIQQNYKKAYELLKATAADEYLRISNGKELAALYESGVGVPKSSVVAYALYNADDSIGDKYSGTSKQRELIAKQLSPSEIARAQSLSEEFVQPGNAANAWKMIDVELERKAK